MVFRISVFCSVYIWITWIKLTFLITFVITRALESLKTEGRNSKLWETISLAEVIKTLEDLIEYFAPPGEDLGNVDFYWANFIIKLEIFRNDRKQWSCSNFESSVASYLAEFEERQNRLKALSNRQDLFQEEVGFKDYLQRSIRHKNFSINNLGWILGSRKIRIQHSVWLLHVISCSRILVELTQVEWNFLIPCKINYCRVWSRWSWRQSIDVVNGEVWDNWRIWLAKIVPTSGTIWSATCTFCWVCFHLFSYLLFFRIGRVRLQVRNSTELSKFCRNGFLAKRQMQLERKTKNL